MARQTIARPRNTEPPGREGLHNQASNLATGEPEPMGVRMCGIAGSTRRISLIVGRRAPPYGHRNDGGSHSSRTRRPRYVGRPGKRGRTWTAPPLDRRPQPSRSPADGLSRRAVRHRLQRRSIQSSRRAEGPGSARGLVSWKFGYGSDLGGVRGLGRSRARSRGLTGCLRFALWDRQRGILKLVRDRLGIKPLYWAYFGGLLLFGSELKALRAHPGWSPRVRPDAIAAYMRHTYIPGPHTVYEGVQKLEPGTALTLNRTRWLSATLGALLGPPTRGRGRREGACRRKRG